MTEAVQRALADDEDANLERVDVQVHDGIVYLDGELQQFEQKMRAGELARGVEGVNKVFNKIEVEP